MNTGDAGASPHTFTKTVTDMMTHQTTKWSGYPEWNCVWQQNCQIVRDTNVDVSGTLNNLAENGDDFNHGTWGVQDGWINGKSNFVPVTEVSMANIGTDTYSFTVDTTTSYYHEGLYVECNAGEVGQTGYLT